MTFKIKCNLSENESRKSVRVKILKAPFVNSLILNQILADRKKAIILNQ